MSVLVHKWFMCAVHVGMFCINTVCRFAAANFHASPIYLAYTDFTEDPRDVSTLIGRTVTFECSYTGLIAPHWDVFIPDQNGTLRMTPTHSSLTEGEMEDLDVGGYINYVSSTDQVATLEVLVTRESNGSEFLCEFSLAGGASASTQRASLTVFGECVDCKLKCTGSLAPQVCGCPLITHACTHTHTHTRTHTHTHTHTNTHKYVQLVDKHIYCSHV